jgi:hypothetical protein
MWFIIELAILGLCLMIALWLGQFLLMIICFIIGLVFNLLEAIVNFFKGE